MKIYLYDAKKLIVKYISFEINGSLLLNYNIDGKDNKITIENDNNDLYIKSNGEVNIRENDMITPSKKLIEYYQYTLEAQELNKIFYLYAMPKNCMTNNDFSVNELSTITIGKKSDSNILYNNELMLDTSVIIKLEESEWYIEAIERSLLFVNGERKKKHKLLMGDVIFIHGLLIIWLNGVIRINNPNNSIRLNGIQHNNDLLVDNSNYSYMGKPTNDISLYKPDDYFYHVSKISEVITEEVISIDSPPTSPKQEELPFILSVATGLTPVASVLIMGLNLYNNISKGNSATTMVTSIITGVSLVIGSLLVPNIIKVYNRRRINKKEQIRLSKYRKYLEEKENEIKLIIVKQSQILYNSFKSTHELIDILNNELKRNVWTKEINDDDFLKIRLGLGTLPAKLKISVAEKHFSLDEDVLLEEMYSLVNKYKNLENIPITTSLLDEPIYALVSESENSQNYINSLILQLITYHSGNDLKIIILTNDEKKWQYMKYLPHNWSDDRTFRFFGINSEEVKKIFEKIEETYTARKNGLTGNYQDNSDDEILEVEIEKEKSYKKFLPYYIIISDTNKYITNNTTIEKIIKENKKLGFTILNIGKTIRDVSNLCNTFITFDANEGWIISKHNKEQLKYKIEDIPILNMNQQTHKLANIPLSVKKVAGELPESLSFLEMFKISKVEQFNCLERWQKNNPTLSLQTLIGVHKDGEDFKLDLHEKYHGPHGLIAGSTGSGKSEFIITYILSLSLNYHPNEVQFVLIDYKGGGLAGAFQNKETGVKLPHLVGTITNLDVSEMNRTLVSIESELKRRQIIFNKVRDKLGESTIDIYKYQKLYREGAIEEPLAHLFIISDEFAELKSQQPEFMQQLVSTARIGRSLGIHLILATQKPSGVVNDQIWSNSKFKICLKVQDKSDSMEMLKKPDAASIKEKGRFYLQVGYDDYYDIGQSGWSGAQYIPSDKIIKRIDDSIDYIDSIGSIISSVNDYATTEETKACGDQLNNIIKYIVSVANSANIVTKQLWLDNIPEYIFLDDLYTKYNYQVRPYLIEPIIGEYDNPTKQEQGVLTLNLTTIGNTIIYGQQGSGKENLLTTIIWSTVIKHSPEEVNFYIIDCGAETLKVFKKVPHVGDILLSDNADKVMDLLKYLYEELEKRKDLFSDYGGDYELYCKNSGNKLPLTTIIINSFEVFSESFSKIVDSFQMLIRDGSKYGIVFILTTSQANGIRSKIVQLCPNKISLQMPNTTDYRNIINSKKGLVPSKFFGRGIIANEDGGYEFQSAYVTQKENIFSYIRQNTEILLRTYKTTAYRLPEMPEIVTYDIIKPYLKSIDKIPIGYEITNKKVTYFNFTKNQANVILAEEQSKCMNAIYGLVNVFSKFKDSVVQVLDYSELYDYENEKVICRNNDFNNDTNEMLNSLKENIKNKKYNFVFIIGISKYNSLLDNQTKKRLKLILQNLNKVSNTTFVLSDSYLEYKNLAMEEWYKSNIDTKTGIWIGTGVGNQIAIKIQDFDINARKINFQHMGVVINDGKYKIVKLLVEGYDEDEE